MVLNLAGRSTHHFRTTSGAYPLNHYRAPIGRAGDLSEVEGSEQRPLEEEHRDKR
jgi:hypothetical protein